MCISLIILQFAKKKIDKELNFTLQIWLQIIKKNRYNTEKIFFSYCHCNTQRTFFFFIEVHQTIWLSTEQQALPC